VERKLPRHLGDQPVHPICGKRACDFPRGDGRVLGVHGTGSFQRPANIPVLLLPPPPSPECARREPENVRRSVPMHLAAQRLQDHLLHCHRPLPRGLGIRDGASSSADVWRTGHKVEAVRSLALESGQIMYSLLWPGRSLTVPGVRASIWEFGRTALYARQQSAEMKRVLIVLISASIAIVSAT
jgi:hypothetical protein